MMPNCYIIMGELDPVQAVASARGLAKEAAHPDRKERVDSIGLSRDVEVVPASWGYPDRCVVTFSPLLRDFDLPKLGRRLRR